jgi:hypothetical protein
VDECKTLEDGYINGQLGVSRAFGDFHIEVWHGGFQFERS